MTNRHLFLYHARNHLSKFWTGKYRVIRILLIYWLIHPGVALAAFRHSWIQGSNLMKFPSAISHYFCDRFILFCCLLPKGTVFPIRSSRKHLRRPPFGPLWLRYSSLNQSLCLRKGNKLIGSV